MPTLAQSTSFFKRLVPSARERAGVLMAPSVFQFLFDLDALQENNPSITTAFRMNDGLGIWHNGRLIYLIIPNLYDYVRVVPCQNDKLYEIPDGIKGVYKVNKTYKYFRFSPQSLPALTALVQNLPNAKMYIESLQGSRIFTGHVRQAVLQEFLNSGRRCPGVSGKTKSHRLVSKARIHFDHVLPFVAGGVSALQNCQILCDTCNLRKGSTAL